MKRTINISDHTLGNQNYGENNETFVNYYCCMEFVNLKKISRLFSQPRQGLSHVLPFVGG